MDLTDPQSFIDPVTGEWHCIACGACCQQVPMLPDLVERGFDRGDGVCIHLDEARHCLIYEARPDKCRIPEDRRREIMPYGCAFVNELGAVSKARFEAGVPGGELAAQRYRDRLTEVGWQGTG